MTEQAQTTLLRWAHNDDELRRFEAEGFRVVPGQKFHRQAHAYAILLEWRGKGLPGEALAKPGTPKMGEGT